jgi:hypothetical protein
LNFFQYRRYVVSKLIPFGVGDSGELMTQDILIVAGSQVESYLEKGYTATLLSQAQGNWNEDNQWVSRTLDNPFLPLPPPASHSDPFPPEESLSSHSDCESISLVITPSLFQKSSLLNSSHFLSISFTPNLSQADLYRHVIDVCEEIASSDNQQSCQLYLATMYLEKSQQHPTHCEATSPAPDLSIPLTINHEPIMCTEPVWCNHTVELQSRLHLWHNPTGHQPSHHFAERRRQGCDHVKYLVYEPNYYHPQGIPGMLLELGFLLRFALCHGRILSLMPLHLMTNPFSHIHDSLHTFCHSSLLECFFQPLSSCQLSDSEIRSAPLAKDDRQLNAYPLRDSRVVKIAKLPSRSHCSSCSSPWTGSVELFDGLHIGLLGYVVSLVDGVLETSVFDILDDGTREMSGFSAFLEPPSLFWMAEMVRYITRPRQWLSLFLREYIQNHLVMVPSSSSSSNHRSPREIVFPDPMVPHYASFHVSDPAYDPSSDSLHLYLSNYAPHTTHIFLSTHSPSSDLLESIIR